MNRFLQTLTGLQLLFTCTVLYGQHDPVTQRIILIGDAGTFTDGKIPAVEKARSLFSMDDQGTTVIYLGDNIYEHGMPPVTAKDYEEKKAVLDAQISLVKDTRAKAFFIPGNHDWNKGKAGGWQRVKNQQHYIQSLQLANVDMMPKDGCPGPVELVVNDQLVIVFMDSQWWLEQLEKPGIESNCECQTEDEITTALKEIASVHPDKLMLVAMHHPFYTHGSHGGYFTLRHHLFPLTDAIHGLYIPMPVIGSIYPVTRGLFGIPQDINHPKYRAMIREVEAALQTHPNVIMASGHDHNLQFIVKDSIRYIVSGSGAKTTRVKKGKYSLFAERTFGFAVVEILQSGNVAIKFYGETSASSDQPLYSYQSEKIVARDNSRPVENVVINFPDSVTAIASTQFKAGGLKKMLLGSNYRKEWAEPVSVKVFDLGTDFGGLTPLRRGGGHQTKSLRLEDKNGDQWVIRGVEKSVTDAALPPDLRGTFAKDLVRDGVSASYPYAALSVPVLAKAAGIPHASPKLIYMPDDPRLGRYRVDFANSLCLIEEREPGGFKNTINTIELAAKLADDNDHEVDQQMFLKARLLDMFMMDFDRHEDQWRWGVVDKEKGNRYVPIPRDRDQVFFINVGLLPWVASWPWITPQVQGFRSKARNIKTYNFNARNLDRAYLNDLDEASWKKMSEDMIHVMTDDVIETALAQQPREIKKYRYSDIIRKLKERRKYFPGEMMSYYRFISKIVDVTGTDKKELFLVNRESDGQVTVMVHKITREGEVARKMYERKFDPSVTKEIRLYGLGGDDQFKIQGGNSSVRIRIIGGNGDDAFDNTSAGGKTILYDLNTEANKISGPFKMKLSGQPSVNNYNGPGYQYNLWIPFISFAFNRDDGLFPGVSLKHIAHGFRKEPYAMSHQLAVNHSLATRAYNFRYHGEFVDAVGAFDLLLNADIKAPTNVTNFFGLGNETHSFKDARPGGINYYRTRYKLSDLSVLLRKQGKTVSFSFGPAFQFYHLDSADNTGRIITNFSESGLLLADVAQKKSYAGGQLSIGFDTRNNKALPVRGIHWQTTLQTLQGLNDASGNLSRLNTDMALYMSFSADPKIVLATRLGYGVNFGDYEFFQAQYIGGTINMRGYRKYRFAGKSAAYNNTDLRIRIADFRTYLFPGSLGILFFHDTGRVWVKDDNSSRWHTGYGGGFWIAPLRRAVLTFSIGVSEEETLPLVSLGFQF